jgi:hypothetical protein
MSCAQDEVALAVSEEKAGAHGFKSTAVCLRIDRAGPRSQSLSTSSQILKTVHTESLSASVQIDSGYPPTSCDLWPAGSPSLTLSPSVETIANTTAQLI